MNEQKYFLSQIKRATDGTYTKGVVVHDTLNNALNGFHAYFGAYGYGKDATTDPAADAVAPRLPMPDEVIAILSGQSNG
jgi:hypothetical protein